MAQSLAKLLLHTERRYLFGIASRHKSGTLSLDEGTMRRWWAMLLALTVVGPGGGLAAEVGLIQVKGAIGPATVGYISRSLDVSAERGYRCLIIQLDTPGGAL